MNREEFKCSKCDSIYFNTEYKCENGHYIKDELNKFSSFNQPQPTSKEVEEALTLLNNLKHLKIEDCNRGILEFDIEDDYEIEFKGLERFIKQALTVSDDWLGTFLGDNLTTSQSNNGQIITIESKYRKEVFNTKEVPSNKTLYQMFFPHFPSPKPNLDK